ncbi:MAG: threonine-phosphate decarboxylase [Clostridia bacterium]|nr:MAG: threonine-phosphate decarboxylase [Clostridia bacterium]
MSLSPPHGGNRTAAEKFGVTAADVLDFSANLNPLGPPPEVLAVMRENLDLIQYYPDPESRQLRLALAEFLQVPPACILPTNGASEAIYLLALSRRPARVLTLAPTFSEYARAAAATGADIIFFPLDKGSSFSLPLTTFLPQCHQADMIFLGHPNNPTGQLLERHTLEVLAEFCQEEGIYLVVDESFIALVTDKETSSYREWIGHFPRLTIVGSLTKSFCLPGLRLGYLLAGPELLGEVSMLQPPWSVNSLAQIAGIAATAASGYLEAARRAIKQEREFLSRALAGMPGLRPYPSRANFLLVEILAPGLTSAGLWESLARRGILVRDCANFPGLGERFFRLAIRNHWENVRLIEALSDLLSERRWVER